MAPAASIDYYETLGVSSTSTQQQIREAYKRAALKSHPDRVSHDDPTRAARTKKFQQINDAYYTLSDPSRRRDYDATRAYQRSSQSQFNTPPHPDANWEDAQFSDVFEEMMRDEGFAAATSESDAAPTKSFWGVVGGLSGGALGFIVGNVPGLLAGAVAGNRLGAVRDAKGKSVYEVFQELPQGDRAKVRMVVAPLLCFGLGFWGGLTYTAVASYFRIWRQRFWRMRLVKR